MSNAIATCPPVIRTLRDAGILRDLDTHLVATVSRTHGGTTEANPAGWLALALASRAVDDGHVCLDLNVAEVNWVRNLQTDLSWENEAADLPCEVTDWCRQITDLAKRDALFVGWSPAIGQPGDTKPFILDGNRLYLRRMHDYERNVARNLLKMAQSASAEIPPEINNRIDSLLTDECQRLAARMALTRRLTIITGGPGTGKTYTAARILALLSHLPKTSGGNLHVRLAAPTGKAAARMGESISQARTEASEAFKSDIIVEPACTLDRLLGFQRNSPYFRHNAEHPLEADVVIIDEASMVDLAKMAKLLDALGPATRLVLLGDMHQLASVQPGSVLAELCESQGLATCVARLTTSRRFPPDSAVGRLSQAINRAQTEPDAVLAWKSVATTSDASAQGRVQLFAVPTHLTGEKGRVQTDFAHSILAGYRDFLAANTPEDAFRALASFRILCALRRGPFGSEFVNSLVESVLAMKNIQKTSLPAELHLDRPLNPTGEFYSHRVVMVTRNDYATGLFNGDVGVVLPDPEKTNGDLTVFFAQDTSEPGQTGPTFRKVPCRLLPTHETAFAMTVHKSQGSEFTRVLVLLPNADCPVLTKELIYTAITRTREDVALWCDRETFVRAAYRCVQRFTGLQEQLDRRGIPA